MKKSQTYLLFGTVILMLFSCKSEQKIGEKTLPKLPFLIDTVMGKPDFVLNKEFMQTASYIPIYFGLYSDTIYTKFWFDLNSSVEFDRQKYKLADSENVYLVIDTNQVISKLEPMEDPSITPTKVSSFAVMIKNKSSDSLNVGFGKYSPIIMEAQDLSGKWRPIEQVFRYRCGTGLSSIVLPPNQILITSAPIFYGTFKTKLRLHFISYHFKDIYSNEFGGSINLSQFEENPNEMRW